MHMLINWNLGAAVELDGKYVGYGAAKFSRSRNQFFEICGKNCLLGSFYVDEKFRGQNIYTNLITKII